MLCDKCSDQVICAFCGELESLSNGPKVIKAPIRFAGRYIILLKYCETMFSDNFFGHDTVTNKTVVLKFLKLDPNASPKQNAEDITQFKLEALFLSKVKSPYVVPFVDHGTKFGKLYLITEFIRGVSLKFYKEGNGLLDETTAIKFSKDIFLGVQAIHHAGIISRDIKPLNLIHNFNKVVHIDLGIGKRIGHHTNRSVKRCFTPFFAAPEQRGGLGSFEMSDIYSCCATIVWLVSHLDEAQLDDVFHSKSGPYVSSDLILEICPNISRAFASFLAKGMHYDHHKRWETADIAYNELCSI